MRAIAGAGERGPLVSTAVLLGSLAVLALTVFNDAGVKDVAVLVGAVIVCVSAYRVLLSWRALVAGVVLVVLFIPIKRYSLPAELPFELEPYRLFVAFVLIGWVGSLLVDPRVRLRRTGFEAPIALIVVSILASELANPGRVAELSSYVAKSLTFTGSFLLVLFLLASVVRSREDIELVVKVLVLGGAAVATTLLFERHFLYNVFDQFEGVVPLLQQDASVSSIYGSEIRLRVLGSAEHAIAMGAALAILVPPALYLAVTGTRRWWLPAVLLGMGTVATASRTSFVMLVVAGAVVLALRWRDVKRFLPALPVVVACTVVVAPGALGTIRSTLFQPGNLIAEQRTVVEGNEALANGRLADLGPALQEFSHQPVFGQGFATRITGFDQPFINAPILDNQWLLTLLETGLLGVAAWMWLLTRALRRLTALARSDESAAGWMATALTASVAAFGIGMFTYDTFAFTQVTFLFFILLGLAGSVLGTAEQARRREVVAAQDFAGPLVARRT